jgi:TetR/AcrR family transcriptional repressor of nem operon
MAVGRRRGDSDTQTQILDVAERLVQTRGFNAFSYADVAAELGITKPALHYHFAGKAELGEALLDRYTDRFTDALAHIDATEANATSKLEAYTGLYAGVLTEGRMCLCGMLAADYLTLPQPMREAVIDFFDHNEGWLAEVLDAGRTEGTLRFSGPSRDAASLIIGTLEGAMLVARTYGDANRFDAAARRLLTEFTGS